MKVVGEASEGPFQQEDKYPDGIAGLPATSSVPVPPVKSAAQVSQARRNITLGVLSGLAVALIWASWAVATRFAVTTTLAPYDVTFLRFSVSALFLWPVLVHHGFALKRIGLGRGAVMVIGAGAPFMLLTSTGMMFAPASHVATLMIGAMPIFVALISALLFGERFSRLQLAGFVAVITGVACIGGYALVFNRAGGEWRGDLLFLLCGVLFAGYTVAQRRSGITAWHAAAFVNVCSFIVFSPIYFVWLRSNLLTAAWQDVAFQAVVQGIGVAILGLFFYGEAARRLGAPRAAIFGALTPALAALLGIPLLGEMPSPVTVIGIVLVSVGVILVSGARWRR